MVEPYINLKGKAYEAMDFYERVFDGQDRSATFIENMAYGERLPGDMHKKVAYGKMTICGTIFNFTDMEYGGLSEDSMISLKVKYSDEEQVKRAYKGLVDGGRVKMELAPALHARQFGWVKDKYGIDWQLLCE